MKMYIASALVAILGIFCFENGEPKKVQIEFPVIPPISWFSCIFNLPNSNQIVNSSDIKFFLFTKSNRDIPYNLEIDGPIGTFFDKRAPVKIVSHGFLGSYHAGEGVKNAYLNISTITNVILVDWSSLAGSVSHIDFDYCGAARNTRVVGNKISEFIRYIVKQGVALNQFHLIGHSLGAHVSAFAAKTFTSPKLERLTALDPAYPSFQNLDNKDRLAPTDAAFVDVIHTNSQEDKKSKLGFGFTEPRGHFDYYPNGGHRQSGCFLWTCSHSRVWDLMAESIRRPKGFPARKCSSWPDYVNENCRLNETIHMGQDRGKGTDGIYFLDTSNQTPYGRGTEEDSCFAPWCPDPVYKTGKVKCPLVWESRVLGDALPKYAVPSAAGGDQNFIARAEMGELGHFKFVVGRYEEGQSFVSLDGEIISNTSYGVLTNPNNCILTWDKTLSDYVVPTAHGYYTYVGRAGIDEELLSGEVAAATLHVAGKNNQTYSVKAFEILQSHAIGINLEITNFEFDQDIFAGSKDFIGMEEIINNGDTTISQSITHKKKIKQSNKLTTSTDWKHVFEVCIKMEPKVSVEADNLTASVSGPKIELCYTFTKTTGEEKTIFSESEHEVVVTTEIEVPKSTSVKICSSIVVIDDFKVDYTATGRYSAPGLTAEDIADILKEDNKYGVVDGDAILIEEKGSFVGTVAFSPQFIVVPYDSVSACSQLNKRIMH